MKRGAEHQFHKSLADVFEEPRMLAPGKTWEGTARPAARNRLLQHDRPQRKFLPGTRNDQGGSHEAFDDHAHFVL